MHTYIHKHTKIVIKEEGAVNLEIGKMKGVGGMGFGQGNRMEKEWVK